MRCSHCGDFFTGDFLEYVSGKPFCSSCCSDLASSDSDFARCYKNCKTPFGRFLQRAAVFFNNHPSFLFCIIAFFVIAFLLYSVCGLNELSIIFDISKWLLYISCLALLLFLFYIGYRFVKKASPFVASAIFLILAVATIGHIEAYSAKYDFSDLSASGYPTKYYFDFSYTFHQANKSKVGNEWDITLHLNGKEMHHSDRLILSPIAFVEVSCTEKDPVYNEQGSKSVMLHFDEYSREELQEGFFVNISVPVMEKGGSFAGKQTFWICKLYFKQTEPYSSLNLYIISSFAFVCIVFGYFIISGIIKKSYFSYHEISSDAAVPVPLQNDTPSDAFVFELSEFSSDFSSEPSSIYDEISYLNDKLADVLKQNQTLKEQLAEEQHRSKQSFIYSSDEETLLQNVRDLETDNRLLFNEIKSLQHEKEQFQKFNILFGEFCSMLISAFIISVFHCSSFWEYVLCAAISFFIGAFICFLVMCGLFAYQNYFAPEVPLSERLHPFLYWPLVLIIHIAGSVLIYNFFISLT